MKTFWRWTGTIFFALVFIFLTVAGIGTSLPIAHSAECVTFLTAAPDAVFYAINDERSSVAWRPELRSVSLTSGSGKTAVWRETYKDGQVLTLRTVTGSLLRGPNGLRVDNLVRSIPFDPRAGFDGTWTYTISAPREPAPTVVSIEEQGNIYNPVFRFLSKYIFGYTGSIRTYLGDLSQKYGESPAITCPSPTPSPPPE